MGCDRDRYEETGCMREGNIEKDIWTSGTARNVENKK
jgi:hypothetical protein